MACICSVDSPSAFKTTASGLPANCVPVNTSTVWNCRRIASSLKRHHAANGLTAKSSICQVFVLQVFVLQVFVLQVFVLQVFDLQRLRFATSSICVFRPAVPPDL